MAHSLLLVVVVTVWLSSAAAGSSIYFDYEDVTAGLHEMVELTCGVEGHFRYCTWETERGDTFQVEDVHAGLHPGMRAPSNLTHNQCGIVVNALTETFLGKWTCRVYLTGTDLKAERTVGKALDCPASFSQIGTECYYIHRENKMSWEEAREFCKSLNSTSDLAVMNDCHQQQLVWYKIHVEDPNDNWYWIGGRDPNLEGSWHWVNGEAVDMGMPFWYPSYPDNIGECIRLHYRYGYFYNYPCSSNCYMICQILY